MFFDKGYFEGEEIPQAIVALRERAISGKPYPYYLQNAEGLHIFRNSQELMDYARLKLMVGLNNEIGDCYCRAVPYTPSDQLFLCQCYDCGKVGAVCHHGSPDMGDIAYRAMHRKNYFCARSGWYYEGGHGYFGGRRMICRECTEIRKQHPEKWKQTGQFRFEEVNT